MTEYEPGTIVRADTLRAGDKLLMRRNAMSGYVWTDGDGATYATTEVTDVRPMVVIDPDDTEQVTALLHGFYGSPVPYIEDVESMQAALRSLLPTPKPAEPTGLGAVVEDADGNRWIRTDLDAPAWTGWDRALTRVSYSTLDVMRVLSEGVQS